MLRRNGGKSTTAMATVRAELHRLRAPTARAAGESHAAIFDAHLLLLDDEDLPAAVRERIADGADGPHAWDAATEQIAGRFEALDDPYLQARAADVRAVAQQTLRALLGAVSRRGVGPGVLIAADLTPAEAAELDPVRTAGVLLAHGSATSHSAILARTRGIPAVAGAGPAVLDIPEGHAGRPGRRHWRSGGRPGRHGAGIVPATGERAGGTAGTRGWPSDAHRR